MFRSPGPDCGVALFCSVMLADMYIMHGSSNTQCMIQKR